MKNEVVEKLEIILANSYALALKTQNYHWNVVGTNFKQLHEMFGGQYENLSEAIDLIAERIRALESKVEGTFENFFKLSQIKAADKNLKSDEMLKDLLSSNEILVKFLKEGITISQKDSDEATADMLIGRVEDHEKAMWMIRSSVG
jgi:starvation-inducible DNA-binding protein